ncbi:acetyl-CoA carboxylase biotin carboxyl carrier protein [Spirulina sp. CS-785/01]|uniref:acetyl-CoA carboxylase biotin carboxyl carrier protein n=1 Tax=Spirulina sp. CS-785/01 TaxID=3021716 RepID=UPI00232EC340|nr:acetyl-CoA carboxylase biotin carboxyl carrier protein [Spirulina sp. CS-785/01]MDB9313482.1 acetyl-CoA carboxylase biotin carboxyl carrier protein [Spirulina sp. CS-785/01]
MPIDYQQVRELIAAIAQTDIVEMNLKSDEFELTVKKGSPPQGMTMAEGSTVAMMPPVSPTANQSPPSAPPTDSTPPPTSEPKGVEITSPMVGTFYRSPAPDESPFVDIGDQVKSGQTVCIIEAMKLMNEIEAEVSGQILEILVENGEPVEYGQALMRVNPN